MVRLNHFEGRFHPFPLWASTYTGAVEEKEPIPTGAVAVLLDNHRTFLNFLERRLGNRALAEDILQDAFTRNLDKFDAVGEEAIVPWFYRTLRNAAIDRYRRQGTANKALEAFARELEVHAHPMPDLESEICECVTRLAHTLKPEYADVLQAVDVEGQAVKEFADARGISASNAGVRAFRAREALRKRVVQSCGTCAEHGCLNCTCGTSPRVS